MCDKHVVKMGLEAVGMLSNCLPEGVRPWNQTHLKHPCSIWVNFAKQNYLWLVEHAYAVFDEYTYRYGKIHKSVEALQVCEKNIDKVQFQQDGMTSFAQAMPDEYKNPDPVVAYRGYYIGAKQHVAVWRKQRGAPEWWQSKEELVGNEAV